MLYRLIIMKNLEFGILNELYGSRLSPRQREIIGNYYDFDLSLSEIADNFGITRQAACDALKKGEKALENFEQEMGFYAKLTGIKSDAEKLRALLDDNRTEDAKKVTDELLGRL